MGTTDIASVTHWPECAELMCGGPSWIRTSEGVSQQIYSLPRLATSVSTHTCCLNNEVYYTAPKIKCQTEICRCCDSVGCARTVCVRLRMTGVALCPVAAGLRFPQSASASADDRIGWANGSPAHLTVPVPVVLLLSSLRCATSIGDAFDAVLRDG